MNKETSSRVSTIASNILSMKPVNEHGTSNWAPAFNNLLEQAKILAGSALSQDETPGQQPGPGLHKIPSGIHPAPAEFTAAQIAQDQILHFFHYAHLPPQLQATSRLFFILAAAMVNTLPRNPERTVALRKLLEAKDAAVRANLPAPGLGELEKRCNDAQQTTVASKPDDDFDEPKVTGGHDEDRDGPLKFDG